VRSPEGYCYHCGYYRLLDPYTCLCAACEEGWLVSRGLAILPDLVYDSVKPDIPAQGGHFIMTDTKTAAESAALVLKYKAEAEKFAAEARKANTEAAQSECALEDQQIDLRQKQRIETELLALDTYNFTYRFSSGVDDSTVKTCIDKLTFWHRTNATAPIEIIFNSPGGSVFAGMDLFDYIQDLKVTHDVTTTARGYAASMGGILLQAGTKRVMGKEAYILIHEVSTWAGGKVGEIEDEYNFLRKISERVVNIFADRAKQAGANNTATHPITAAQVRKNWNRTDWWLDSTEALKLGIVDEVR
jgi:ATP-dependent Clp endopeptidase proteolytic subunit ClpP